MSRLFVITVFVFAWSKKYTLLLLGLQQLRSNLVRGGIVVASPQLLVSIRQVAACNFQLRVLAGSSTPNLPFNLRTESPIKCKSVQRFKQGARMWQATDDRQTTLLRNASQSAKSLALQEETPLKNTYVGKAVGWWASVVWSVGVWQLLHAHRSTIWRRLLPFVSYSFAWNAVKWLRQTPGRTLIGAKAELGPHWTHKRTTKRESYGQAGGLAADRPHHL